MPEIRISKEGMIDCRKVVAEFGGSLDGAGMKEDGDGWNVTVTAEEYARILELCAEGSTAEAAVRLIFVATRGVR